MTDSKPDSQDFYQLYNTAWSAAINIVNQHGEIIGAIDSYIPKFLRRKACQNMSAEQADSTFRTAVDIVCELQQFKRKSIGSSIPETTKRYEILLSLSKHLISKFPDAPELFISKACGQIELMWSR